MHLSRSSIPCQSVFLVLLPFGVRGVVEAPIRDRSSTHRRLKGLGRRGKAHGTEVAAVGPARHCHALWIGQTSAHRPLHACHLFKEREI